MHCVECPQYSTRLEALGYLCPSCLLRAFDSFITNIYKRFLFLMKTRICKRFSLFFQRLLYLCMPDRLFCGSTWTTKIACNKKLKLFLLCSFYSLIYVGDEVKFVRKASKTQSRHASDKNIHGRWDWPS